MSFKKMKTVLTIAGSDSSGGAGIQADIKTMIANGVYGMSAVTALTAQNTTGVRGIMEVSPEFLKLQLDAVFEDIFPDAVKIGMLSGKGIVRAAADRLEYYCAERIVLDPVMISTSGSKLMDDAAVEAVISSLAPLADIITPNIPEAEVLSGMKIITHRDMEKAGAYIGEKCRCAVLVKGGHNVNDADDLLYENGGFEWIESRRIDNKNTHGTGCTLSSAIASNLAKGYSIAESVRLAKEYISGALSAMLDLGRGNGPLNHGYNIK